MGAQASTCTEQALKNRTATNATGNKSEDSLLDLGSSVHELKQRPQMIKI